MEVTEKLTKQIKETRYLAVENTERYRPIIRYFFRQYECLEYWLFKEDVFQALCQEDPFQDYTLELCEQDLLKLVEWGNLANVQDTSNVATVEEFKNRKYRYQLTEYAIEIERLVLRLENLKVETSSLEPKLFEKIKQTLEKMLILTSPKEVNSCFEELDHNFTTLNNNYKDFLKMFTETKAEELMRSQAFLIYKDRVISYLKDFIEGFQLNSIKIGNILSSYTKEKENEIIDLLMEYQKNIPRLEPNFDFDYLRGIYLGKWKSVVKWFQNENGYDSESERLKRAINDIINKISKNVLAIIENNSTGTNRTNEYKHILSLFDKCSDMKEIEELSSAVFGIIQVKHYTNIQNRTESPDVSSYDLSIEPIPLKSHSRKMKERAEKRPIADKTFEKEIQMKKIMEEKRKEQELLEKYRNKKIISLNELDNISTFERRFLLSLLTKGINQKKKVYDGTYGISYEVKKISDRQIELKSQDGILSLPEYQIYFEDEKK